MGTQYRSAIFHESEAQKETAERKIAEVTAAGIWPDAIVTEVAPLETFYPAEAYHDDYLNRNPTQPSARPSSRRRSRSSAASTSSA